MIEAISSILTATVMALLIKDHLRDKPKLELERYHYEERSTRILEMIAFMECYVFRIRNVGRRDAPDATASVSIREFGSIELSQGSGDLQWIPPSQVAERRHSEPAFTFTRDGWALLELPLTYMKGRGEVALKLHGGTKPTILHFVYWPSHRPKGEKPVELLWTRSWMIPIDRMMLWIIYDLVPALLKVVRRAYRWVLRKAVNRRVKLERQAGSLVSRKPSSKNSDS